MTRTTTEVVAHQGMTQHQAPPPVGAAGVGGHSMSGFIQDQLARQVHQSFETLVRRCKL